MAVIAQPSNRGSAEGVTIELQASFCTICGNEPVTPDLSPSTPSMEVGGGGRGGGEAAGGVVVVVEGEMGREGNRFR